MHNKATSVSPCHPPGKSIARFVVLMSWLIKICGITSAEDARMVSSSGVDYIGILVNVIQSPRAVTIEKAQEIIAATTVPVILLTYNHPLSTIRHMVKALQPHGVQLAGTEDDDFALAVRDALEVELWKSIHLPSGSSQSDLAESCAARINRLLHGGMDKIVLDTAIYKRGTVLHGGTGVQCDWQLAKDIKHMTDACLFLAGGIQPDNVRRALLEVDPDGIDLSSGVERGVGIKDATLVARLVAQVKGTSRNI